MTDTATRALLDQMRAATRQANNETARAAQHLGSPIHRMNPRGAHLTLTLRLARGMAAGIITPCRHLRPDAPQPIYWPAWQPRHLCCRCCLNHANATIAGTPEMHRCDTCHQFNGECFPGLIQAPAVALPRLGFAAGPISLIFGLCGDCQATTGITPAGLDP